MLKIDQTNPFIAQWNENNYRLNAARGGLLESTLRKIKNILLYIPNSIVAACINPRSETPFNPSFLSERNYHEFSREIVTPDSVRICATVNVVKGATSQSPYVILFNPLGANKEIHEELKFRLIQKNCNVITFDYRGYGSTKYAEDLVIDGESVYQYVTKECGVEPNNVHFYGFSLGGALAAQVKALHPESEGKYVGDRPFKSVFSLITENCSIEKFGWLVKKITSFAAALFLALPIYLLGWEWDGRVAAQMKGDKRVIYHPNDILIPFAASFAALCPSYQAIRLNPNTTGFSTHFAPLESHTTENGADPMDLITNFLSQDSA